MGQKLKGMDMAVKRLLIINIVVVVFLCIASPNFSQANNIYSILQNLPTLGIVCVGEMLVILMGHFDLSVGAVAAIVSCIIGALVDILHMPILLAVLIALAAAVLIGAGNAFLVSKIRINSFIGTLGTMTILRGAALLMTQGQSNSLNFQEFLWIGRGRIFSIIPVSLVIMIAIYLIVFYILKYTNRGRDFFAIGDNRTAAELMGVNIPRVEWTGFMTSALLAGVTGVVVASSMGASLPGMADSMEMNAIAAVVLGGVALSGGKGSLLGVFLGVLLLRFLSNGLVLLGVSSYYQTVVNGAVLMIAVALDAFVLLRQQKVEA